MGDLGLREIDCNCSVRLPADPAQRVWVFRTEPHVRQIRPDGPAAGRLLEGDAITAIDGLLITTREAGLRFARVSPGVPVTLTVRREGRVRQVRIVPGPICYEQALGSMRPTAAPAAAIVTPEAAETPQAGPEARAGASEPPMPAWVSASSPAEQPAPASARGSRAPRPPVSPGGLPRGWIGIGLSCDDCGLERESPELPSVWHFGGPPEISYVDPESPAAQAGLRRGDILTHVDGVSLLTEEGGRRFGALVPGQSIRLSLRRGVETRVVNLVPRVRHDPASEYLRSMAQVKEELRRLQDTRRLEVMQRGIAEMQLKLGRMELSRVATERRRLRYSGIVGSSDVEVRGLGTVIVTTDEATGELVITTSEATVRIRSNPEGSAPKPR